MTCAVVAVRQRLFGLHLMRRFCADIQVRYLDTGPIASYVQAIRHLNTIGRTARATSPRLSEGLTAGVRFTFW